MAERRVVIGHYFLKSVDSPAGLADLSTASKMIWEGKKFRFRFPRPALLMGIVNVTPDSFSDGGQYFEATRAIEHALALAEEGADILDVGGESTRPRAEIVSEAEELRRVLPVIRGIKERCNLPISIDTQKPQVARQAVEAGACIINDIAASRSDLEMWDVVKKSGAGYVLMHMQGTPQTMQINPQYENVVSEVSEFFADRLKRLSEHGVSMNATVIDPGIGFGKTIEHNLQLLASVRGFTIYERPVLMGASRKSFIGKLLATDAKERLHGSVACAAWAVLNGVQIIRAHDIGATRQTVRMIEEIAARAPRSSENDGHSFLH